MEIHELTVKLDEANSEIASLKQQLEDRRIAYSLAELELRRQYNSRLHDLVSPMAILPKGLYEVRPADPDHDPMGALCEIWVPSDEDDGYLFCSDLDKTEGMYLCELLSRCAEAVQSPDYLAGSTGHEASEQMGSAIRGAIADLKSLHYVPPEAIFERIQLVIEDLEAAAQGTGEANDGVVAGATSEA